ncbi:MAG: STAS domain-containing protein [Deltaproteobacteria bacterium]|nr:STAS domain-containing protein [Deltaproteobacteria bacterium]
MNGGFKHIACNRQGEVAVVQLLDKRLLAEQDVDETAEELFELVNGYEVTRMIVDFSQVRFIAARMLGKLITLHKFLRFKEGNFCLFGIEEAVLEAFRITRLTTTFEIADDEAAALNRLGA